ncbi:MAG: hypothetical protein RRB13_16620 [bacterium]|nr:hypothetical protein [bacterium]
MKTLTLFCCALLFAASTLAADKATISCPKTLDPAKVKKYQLITLERKTPMYIIAKIYAPHAKTTEERAQTAMQAALEIQKDNQADDVWVIMIRSPDQPESPWRAHASFNPEAHRDKHVVWRVVTQVASRPRYNAQFKTYCQEWEPSKIKPLKSTQVDHIDPPPPEIHHTADGKFCALSHEVYDKAFQFAVKEDWDAVTEIVNSPDAFSIKEDIEVYLVDESHKKFVILRPKGSDQLLWCFPDVLKD